MNNENKIEVITVDAEISNVDLVTDFVNIYLERMGCNIKTITQFDIAVDEIFSNIAYYAYENKGQATISVYKEEKPDRAVLSFADNGKKYNPLEKDDPDVNLSAEERQVGGLGIFIVKKSMDEIIYEYKDDMNILTIKKYI